MRTLIIATMVAYGLFSTPASTQQQSQGKALISDFAGIWGRNYRLEDQAVRSRLVDLGL
jgi:hypothetical protein